CLLGLYRVQQHEHRQYGLRCERVGQQDFADRVDRCEICGHRSSGRNRRLLSLHAELLLRYSRRRGALFRLRALTMRRYVERDLRRHRLEVCTEVGCLPRRHALAIQWRVGERPFSRTTTSLLRRDCASATERRTPSTVEVTAFGSCAFDKIMP